MASQHPASQPPASQPPPAAFPWAASAHGRSEFLRLRSVVEALVRIAEHAGDTESFLLDTTATVMELTRATGAVVLMADAAGRLSVASARGQMEGLDDGIFDGGQTLARLCLETRQVVHSGVAYADTRIAGDTCRDRTLYSLIATPLRFGDVVLGALEVCSSVTRAFDAIDTQAAELIGNAIGGALGRQVALDDNARLLRRLEANLLDSQATARRFRDAALYDALTGLPNRRHFEARLEDACRAHQGVANGFAVLFLDLDGFKAINDDHGHATGDAVLREAAQALTSCLRESDIVSRLGGDEFVVLLGWMRNATRDVRAIASAIDEALAQPRVIDGHELVIRASIGWVAHDGASDATGMLSAADAAMYTQKKARRRR